jgi:hemerythrin
MDIVNWDAKYQTGNATVDTQHKELFRMVNSLHSAIVEGHGKEAMGPTLDKLAKYVVEHFETEQKLMVQKKYPGYPAHKAIHEDLTKKAVDLIEKYHAGKLALSITVSQFLGDWVKHHIQDEDIKMIKWVQEHN